MRPIICLVVLLQFSFVTAAKTVTITWHRTIETIMILRAISPDDYFFNKIAADKKGRPMLYKARQRFARFKDHLAVARTQQMLDETKDLGGILFSGVLYAEELPGTALKSQPADFYWPQHKQALIDYMQVLGDFYREADVQKFLDNNRVFYEGAMAEAEQYIARGTVATMEAYFGKRSAGYKMYILPMSPYGWGFSATTYHKAGPIQHAIISPVSNISWDGVSTITEYGFGGPKAKEHYQELVIHEYVHSFITDVLLTDTMKQLVARYDTLYTPLLDSAMNEIAYSGWWSHVNEYLVRLGEIRIAQKLDPEGANALRRVNYNEAKFVLIPEGEKLMEGYERNRKTYTTIDSYLPVLINGMAAITKAEVDKRVAEK